VPNIIDAVKRGVLEAGGLPLTFPTISLGEILVSPTSMLYRNLLAMETEEMIKAYPMDSVVLIGGCDKTIPAQLMASVSANLPAIFEVTGAMHTGNYKEKRIGACTDCRSYWAKYRSGTISVEELDRVQSSLCPTGGTCMVMGTASTMACLTETMGMMLPGGATPLSGTGERLRHAAATGRQAVTLADRQYPRPRDIITKDAFYNMLTVLAAISGSTNAVVHLIALARRCNIPLPLEEFHKISQGIPLCVNCKPAGQFYMEDFHEAGGVPALLKALKNKLILNTINVAGVALNDLLKSYHGPEKWQSVIFGLNKPLGEKGTISVLYGSLAPNGAVIKRAAASKHLLNHKGPAVVFNSPEDIARLIDDPDLQITPDHILVLRNAGPRACGMPEAGSLPIPKYLAEKGVKDMVRISDARMSGTAYGTVILHCSPEAAIGGPLSIVKNGDEIELNLDKREINLNIPEHEFHARHKRWKPPPLPERGWPRLHAEHVLQADQGADLEFL
jgi:dihydroxy-acid dehydratase